MEGLPFKEIGEGERSKNEAAGDPRSEGEAVERDTVLAQGVTSRS